MSQTCQKMSLLLVFKPTHHKTTIPTRLKDLGILTCYSALSVQRLSIYNFCWLRRNLLAYTLDMPFITQTEINTLGSDTNHNTHLQGCMVHLVNFKKISLIKIKPYFS